VPSGRSWRLALLLTFWAGILSSSKKPGFSGRPVDRPSSTQNQRPGHWPEFSRVARHSQIRTQDEKGVDWKLGWSEGRILRDRPHPGAGHSVNEHDPATNDNRVSSYRNDLFDKLAAAQPAPARQKRWCGRPRRYGVRPTQAPLHSRVFEHHDIARLGPARAEMVLEDQDALSGVK